MKLKKHFNHLFILVSILSLSLFANAQLRKITIDEAIDLGIRNSHQLKYDSAKITEAVAQLKEARERKLPDAGVSGSHIRLNNPNVDLKIKSNNTTGGSQQPRGKISSATYGIVNFSVPLYAGFKIKYGIESARFLEEASRLDATDNRDEIILNTIYAFDNLYKAKAAVDLVNENLGSAKERVKQFTSFERNGVIPRNDLLKAELQQSNTELSLLDAENNWKLANINMNIMLGLPDSTVLDPDIIFFDVTDKLKSVEEFMQAAVQHRNDMASAGLKEKAAGAEIKAVKSELYPSLALTGGYIALYVPNFVTVTNAVNVGVGVQYKLSSLWKNNSKVQQAQAREIQALASQASLADAVRLQVHQAYLEYVLDIKKIETYKHAVAQAEENFNIVKNKYDNALATTTDLLDADVAQLQSRLNYAFSQADASAAYSKLLKSAGILDKQTHLKN